MMNIEILKHFNYISNLFINPPHFISGTKRSTSAKVRPDFESVTRQGLCIKGS